MAGHSLGSHNQHRDHDGALQDAVQAGTSGRSGDRAALAKASASSGDDSVSSSSSSPITRRSWSEGGAGVIGHGRGSGHLRPPIWRISPTRSVPRRLPGSRMVIDRPCAHRIHTQWSRYYAFLA